MLAFAGAQAPKPTEVTYTHRIKIKDAAGKEACAVKFYSDKLKVEFDGKSLTAKLKESTNKRKYYAGETVVAEIKYSDDGFKLRSPQGKLAWKVKYKEGKITIADNEESTDAYEFRSDENRIKIKRTEKEVAQVKFYPDTGKLKVKAPDGTEKFVTESKKLSAVPGVLACSALSKRAQAIIMAELESEGK